MSGAVGMTVTPVVGFSSDLVVATELWQCRSSDSRTLNPDILLDTHDFSKLCIFSSFEGRQNTFSFG